MNLLPPQPAQAMGALIALALCLLGTSTLAQGPTLGAADGELRLAQPVRPIKDRAKVYLVQLKEPSVAGYAGGKGGMPATKPQPGERLEVGVAAVRNYADYLEGIQTKLLAGAGVREAPIHTYRYALNGFAALLTPAEVSRLFATGQVLRVWEDQERTTGTNNSSSFLGLLDLEGGLRAEHELRGEDVIIGVIDSGIALDHPSFKDSEDRIPRLCQADWAQNSFLGVWLCRRVRNDPPQTSVYDPLDRFAGICQSGDGFPANSCNNKLLGARYYADGFLARHTLDDGETLSPLDADGHGTHIASIAAGNAVDASLFGARVASISGVAPRARIAVYKACWLKPGDTRATCTTADLARAIDDAVADGVDIINYSVGSSTEFELTAPDDIALLNAFQAGILSVVAAGNDGPSLAKVGSPANAPWVLTVAASTQTGERFERAIRINEPTRLAGLYVAREASFTPLLSSQDAAISAAVILVDDGVDTLTDGTAGNIYDACEELTNGDELNDRIALIIRGGCPFQDKVSRAESAGALAVLVYNNAGEPIEMMGDAGSVDIPALMISNLDGLRLVDELTAGEPVVAELEKGLFISRNQSGNIVADFSSRGPNTAVLDVMKPDITAPGVNILGAHTPTVANGVKEELFQYLSGTSMSTPHATGAAALIIEAHPDWDPGRIKSALTTSAYIGLTRQDGGTADPLDMGSGHIDPNSALEPGLVYESSYAEHAAFVCSLEDTPLNDQECAALAAAGFSNSARDLNQPGITLGELISGDTISRRVTHLGDPTTYTATVTAPPGVGVTLDQNNIALGDEQTAEFNLRFDLQGGLVNQWAFGRIVWSDGVREVASPIAVRPVALRVPGTVAGRGSNGNLTFPIDFGYNGAYSAGVHGLRAPLSISGFVDDDPSNTFNFRVDNGVVTHIITIPPDQAYARFALFDSLTDGNDDLDLYLFFCQNNLCSQIAESGSFTSEEEIDLAFPTAGTYAALVHGFETDQISGGPGANYELQAWSFGVIDNVGNLTVTAPAAAIQGVTDNIQLNWTGLDPSTRYLGGISHSSSVGLEALTIVTVDAP
jgi:subtilisin family serine protease